MIYSPRPPERSRISWFGANHPPEAVTEAVAHGFWLDEQPATPESLSQPAFLNNLAAVVFAQCDQIAENIRQHAPVLLDNGSLVIVRTLDDQANETPDIIKAIVAANLRVRGIPSERLPANYQTIDEIPVVPYLWFCEARYTTRQLFEEVRQTMFDPTANMSLTPTLEPETVLTPQQTLLLRRSFADCDELHLYELDDGRSSAKVYRAHATLKLGAGARWPQSWFIKFDLRDRVLQEYNNYTDWVHPYIPFYLGPRLQLERCALGSTEGLLVGDFVEESEGLDSCAPSGRAAAAISCLFDRTLAGWHRAITQVDKSVSDGLLGVFPQEYRFGEERLQRARDLGATRSVGELRLMLRKCVSKPILVGPVHGDLHARNVRVRASDAVVIDFRARTNRLVLSDPASLEASLLIDGFGRAGPEMEVPLELVRAMYVHPILDGLWPHPHPKSSYYWFDCCVRQIRRFARQWERGENQYAGALAFALLWKASKDKDVPEPEASRRAVAYLLAEQILTSTFGA